MSLPAEDIGWTPTTMCHPIAYVCFYYNDQICNTNEGTTFISNNTKTFMVNKAINLTQLVELVQQKINIEPHQHFHFWCPIFEPRQPNMYTCFILGNDHDVRQTFNIFYNNPTLPFVELFTKICNNNNPPNNQHDSTSNLEDLLDEYKSSADCWVKNHCNNSDSDSNMPHFHEPIF